MRTLKTLPSLFTVLTMGLLVVVISSGFLPFLSPRHLETIVVRNIFVSASSFLDERTIVVAGYWEARDQRRPIIVASFDAISGEENRRYQIDAFAQPVANFRFSGDAELLAVEVLDQAVGIWRVRSGERVQLLPLPAGDWRIQFLPKDGIQLGSKVWRLSDGALVSAFDPPKKPSVSDANEHTSPDGSLVAVVRRHDSGGETARVEIKRVDGGSVLHSLDIDYDPSLVRIWFSPDSQIMAVAQGRAGDKGGGFYTIHLRKAATGRLINTIRGGPECHFGGWSTDSSIVLLSCLDYPHGYRLKTFRL